MRDMRFLWVLFYFINYYILFSPPENGDIVASSSTCTTWIFARNHFNRAVVFSLSLYGIKWTLISPLRRMAARTNLKKHTLRFERNPWPIAGHAVGNGSLRVGIDRTFIQQFSKNSNLWHYLLVPTPNVKRTLVHAEENDKKELDCKTWRLSTVAVCTSVTSKECIPAGMITSRWKVLDPMWIFVTLNFIRFLFEIFTYVPCNHGHQLNVIRQRV